MGTINQMDPTATHPRDMPAQPGSPGYVPPADYRTIVDAQLALIEKFLTAASAMGPAAA